MKLFPAAILPAAFILLISSCGSVDTAKVYPEMVADIDPVPIGIISAEFDRLLSSRVNKLDVTVSFHPRLNSVALEFRNEFVTYRQFWDASARQQFAAALEHYKENYAERKLVDRYSRTRSVYGKVQGRLEWTAASYSQNYLAYPEIEIGYRFKENVPYFATLMLSTLEEENDISGANRTESVQLNMYFTRAQATELVALFDQGFLMGLISNVGRAKSSEPLVVDYYQEFEEEDN